MAQKTLLQKIIIKKNGYDDSNISIGVDAENVFIQTAQNEYISVKQMYDSYKTLVENSSPVYFNNGATGKYTEEEVFGTHLDDSQNVVQNSNYKIWIGPEE